MTTFTEKLEEILSKFHSDLHNGDAHIVFSIDYNICKSETLVAIKNLILEEMPLANRKLSLQEKFADHFYDGYNKYRTELLKALEMEG